MIPKFEIGDVVRCINDRGSDLVENKKYRVIGHNDGDLLLEGVLSSWMASRFVAVDENPASPIRTRREIVPGVYGKVWVETNGRLSIRFNADSPSSETLREAAHLFNQIAEVLEENSK